MTDKEIVYWLEKEIYEIESYNDDYGGGVKLTYQCQEYYNHSLRKLIVRLNAKPKSYRVANYLLVIVIGLYIICFVVCITEQSQNRVYWVNLIAMIANTYNMITLQMIKRRSNANG